MRAPRREPASAWSLRRFRQTAGNGDQAVLILVQSRHARQQPARVRMQGMIEQPAHRGLLDGPAGVHHQDPIGGLGDHPHVVGDHHDRHAELVAQIHQQFEDLCLDGHIQRGRRLIGDQQPRAADQRDRQHDALTLAAGQLMRIIGHARSGGGDSDLLQHLDGAGETILLGQAFMRADRFHDLLANGEDRVQRGHRFLENHCDAGATQTLHRAVGQFQKILSLELDAAAADAGRRAWQQAHDGQRGDAFAAAGFADDAEDFALLQAEGNVFDGGHLAAAGLERCGEVADLQQTHC